ncbi:hypothetical protein NQ318_019721 [Aromia moschata]|uniref:G-protein coupled receptors family 2 profile 2 domain-containing protein n=1 Tax=Aromia moschata TaxID=1265417 RepID=A0AAV8Z6A0_9CUCU|nr:hypothetical protein NQ318_019721 [Aromia moschata]
MYLFTLLTYLLITTLLSRGYTTEKCCGPSEHLQILQNLTYQCIEDVTKRLGIITDQTNFLETNTDGDCVDVKDDILTHSFINESFVRVGLPECKLIVDRELDEDIDLYQTVIDVRRNPDYCIDKNEKGSFSLRQCREDVRECEHVRCVKKCCPDGQSFVNGPNCLDTYTHGLNLSYSTRIEEPEGPFAIISNRTCERIYIMNEERYIFNLDKDGIFSYWRNQSNSFVPEAIDEKFSYCIEHAKLKKANGFMVFKCFEEKEYKLKFGYTLVPKIMSCVFLSLTIIIYFVLNETRSLFGKILMNYCVSTLFLFSILVYAHIELSPTDLTCKLTAYALVFVSTVSFAWLNIMCCDIWWTFGTTKQTVGVHQRKKDLRRLLWYMLYGWGMPTALTLIIFIFSSNPVLPYSIHPFVGTAVCFIENRSGNYAAILFLRLPHLVIQLVNTVLFFKTIVYCLKIKNEINKINDTTKHERNSNFKRDKERLSLILKLSVIMGVTFIFDVMSNFDIKK